MQQKVDLVTRYYDIFVVRGCGGCAAGGGRWGGQVDTIRIAVLFIKCFVKLSLNIAMTIIYEGFDTNVRTAERRCNICDMFDTL